MDGPGGLLWRIVFTILAGSGFLVGSLIYIAFPGRSFDLFQKIVVVLVALILAAASIGIVWVTWAGRRGMMRWMKW